MSPPRHAATLTERYDQALRYARDQRLPADQPRPQPTTAWPSENIALLERYQRWLASGGASPAVIHTIYIPMAGHVLGLNLKPHSQFDLAADLDKALHYIRAKQLGPDWTKVCRTALEKFRRFLRHERGQIEIKVQPFQPDSHADGLPAWLMDQLLRYQHLRQANWRPARLQESLSRFWSSHLRFWNWECQRHAISAATDVKRSHVLDYIDQRLAAGYAARSINQDLRALQAFLRFLQDQDHPVPQALLRLRGLKEPDALPRFLTDDEVGRLRDDLEQRVQAAGQIHQRRDALLDRAAFYLLWQGGLRLGEVEELRLEDLRLADRQLSVRRGKGQKDRTVYLADAAVRALAAFLAVRGDGPTDHVFLYRNQPLSKDLVRGRIKAAGQRVGVRVYPHRLRHTCATQLLNAGCRITSIQKFLGHQRLNSTLIYARVHDQTVADDYFSAMVRIEQRLALAQTTGEVGEASCRSRLLALLDQLRQPELSAAARLDLVAQVQQMVERLASTATTAPDPSLQAGDVPAIAASPTV